MAPNDATNDGDGSDDAESWTCGCVVCAPPRPAALDDDDRTVIGSIEQFGYHVFHIPHTGDDGLPGWAFSVGLYHSFGVPDLAMVGLRPLDMANWINDVAQLVRDGRTLANDDGIEDIIDGYTLLARTVAPGWAEPLFGYLRWFAQELEPPMLQLVWPDPEHRLPWEPEATPSCRENQAHLWLPPDDHAPGMWTDWVASES